MTHWIYLWINCSHSAHCLDQICQRRSHSAGWRFGLMCGVILPPCGFDASLLTWVVFEVTQIYCGDSKKWTTALLRRALSLLRPELTEIMKSTARAVWYKQELARQRLPCFSPPRSDFKRWLIKLRWIKSLVPNMASTDRKTCFSIFFGIIYFNILHSFWIWKRLQSKALTKEVLLSSTRHW